MKKVYVLIKNQFFSIPHKKPNYSQIQLNFLHPLLMIPLILGVLRPRMRFQIFMPWEASQFWL